MNMKKITPIALAVGLACGSIAEASAANKKPNILII